MHDRTTNAPTLSELVDRAETAAGAFLAAADPREARHAAALADRFRDEEGPESALEAYAAAVDRARTRPTAPGADRHTLERLYHAAAAAIRTAHRAAHGRT